MAASRKELRELSLQIAEHQANITRLGERWGQVIVDVLDDSDRETMAKLRSMLDELQKNYKVNTAKSVEQLEYIRRKVEAIRVKAFVKAERELREEAPELIDNETKWSARLLSELTGKKSSAFRKLTDSQSQKILKNSIQINKTWDQWWTNTAYGDVMRIANVVNEGIVQGMTIDQMTRLIMGTKEGNFTDGVLSACRTDARRLARTLCSGVANQAKDQFYRENDDVVSGVEWLDTLDGRTCFHCAGMSRRRWKTDEPHPVPPLHPNCRCVLIPVTELTDLGEDSYRPMANADFESEARRAYEAKYPGKKFDDLSAATRKKYYYQAIRDYEKRTGKPAFSRASGQMSYREYFEQMSERQKKVWLGPERYKLWKSGKYPIDAFIPPWPDKGFTVKQLKEADIASFS